ncbi:MAG: hypothetical protein HY294_06320 [Candidatus Rokubacteria bacterium]|nr:hypothetical protein [Candidatus Rokubacteria bacterium]
MKETAEVRRDRVSVDAASHEFYRTLTSGEESPFKTMKDLFLVAACLGFQLNKRVPLERRQQVFAWSIFSPQDDIPVLRALAIAATGDVKVLLDQGELLTIAEEYANGGISLIEQRVAQEPGDRLLKFAELVVAGVR